MHTCLQGVTHWTRLFTRMITSETKLVGPTITCSPPPTISINDTMPYIQFTAMATDQVSQVDQSYYRMESTACTSQHAPHSMHLTARTSQHAPHSMHLIARAS